MDAIPGNVYRVCFEVDLVRICGKGHSQAPIVPVYHSLVKLYEINDATVDILRNFR